MDFGTPGGLGGRGYSYPTRGAAPISKEVDWLQDYDTWKADWDYRRTPRAESIGPAQGGYIDTPERYVAPVDVNANLIGGQTALPQMPGRWEAGSRTYFDGPPTVQSAAYTPDYEALDAEMAQMMPKFEPRFRQQQAYSNMSGRGQENAIMGQDYTSPTFGQVTGDPAGAQGKGSQFATGGSYANGVYDPNSSSAGVYGASRPKSLWGLF